MLLSTVSKDDKKNKARPRVCHLKEKANEKMNASGIFLVKSMMKVG